jgi:hypothetical protein
MARQRLEPKQTPGDVANEVFHLRMSLNILSHTAETTMPLRMCSRQYGSFATGGINECKIAKSLNECMGLKLGFASQTLRNHLRSRSALA